jgi:hypothetical protein
MNESEKDEYKRDEVRGIFTLGLLAVLVAIRFQNATLMVKIGQHSFDIIPWINITIGLWSLYAFFMVLGLSDDLIGKTSAEVFRISSRIIMWIYFGLSAIFGTTYFILGFPTRSLWVLLLIGFCVVYILLFSLIIRLKSLKEIRKKFKITKLDLLGLILLIVFLISVVALVYYPDERLLIVFFVLGCGSFTLLSLVGEKITQKLKVSQNEKLRQEGGGGKIKF